MRASDTAYEARNRPPAADTAGLDPTEFRNDAVQRLIAAICV
jgi:hypothetical protein